MGGALQGKLKGIVKVLFMEKGKDKCNYLNVRNQLQFSLRR